MPNQQERQLVLLCEIYTTVRLNTELKENFFYYVINERNAAF